MRVKRSLFGTRVAGSAGLIALASLGWGQTAPSLHFYSLGTTQMTLSRVTAMANVLQLKQRLNAAGAPIPVWGAADGSVRLAYNNGELQLFPDLKTETSSGPSLEVGYRYTVDFIKQFGLFPDDVSRWNLAETFVTSRVAGTPSGAMSRQLDPLRSYRYQRLLDGIPVFGKTSIFGATTDSHGLIGLLFNARPVALSTVPVSQKQPDQIDGEYQMRLNNLLNQVPGTPTLLSKTLCYLDQGARYVQPAYRYRVEITGKQGDVEGEELFVPIAVNSPEPLFSEHFTGFDPIIPSTTPPAGVAPATTNVKLGQYVVRQDADQNLILNIANGFYANSAAGAAVTGRSVTRTQYSWDHDWLWKTVGSNPDASQFNAGRVDFAMLVAHGQPWGFSSLSNYGEWVDMHSLDHYGQALGSSNPSHDYTSYIAVASCSMMPAPGDPHGGYYTSGGPFDVYWNIFWGLHGMYGFRTTAGKAACVDGMSTFGLFAGFGAPLAASWINMTSGQDHSNNWNYGTAVYPTGRDLDTMYNLEALPKATNLTMWWTHS